MKILLVGEYYSVNLGDPLLCQTVEKTIKNAYPDAVIVPFDISGKIDYSNHFPVRNYPLDIKLFLLGSFILPTILHRITFYRAFQKDRGRYLRVWLHIKQLIKEHNFDLVVFAGGSLFMDYFAGVVYLIVKHFAGLKTKIIFHACGMSKLDSDSEQLLRKAFKQKNVYSISLRDSFSRFEKMFTVTAKVTETYDTALSCSRYFCRESMQTIDYGIGLIAHSAYREIQKQLVAIFLNSTLSWKVFTNGSTNDHRFAEEILKDAGVPYSKLGNYIVRRPTTSEELVQTVTSFKHIISFRMHSQITAASFGIPCYGFAWDDKIMDFYNKLGFADNYSLGELNMPRIHQALSCDAEHLRKNALKQGDLSCESLIETITAALRSR